MERLVPEPALKELVMTASSTPDYAMVILSMGGLFSVVLILRELRVIQERLREILYTLRDRK